jgi:hypothetical protein
MLAGISVMIIVIVNHVELFFISNMRGFFQTTEGVDKIEFQSSVQGDQEEIRTRWESNKLVAKSVNEKGETESPKRSDSVHEKQRISVESTPRTVPYKLSPERKVHAQEEPHVALDSAKVPAINVPVEDKSTSNNLKGKQKRQTASNSDPLVQNEDRRRKAVTERPTVERGARNAGELAPVGAGSSIVQQKPTVPHPTGSDPDMAPTQRLGPAATLADQALFIVLGDGRSGSEWVLSILNQHPHICASGSFPTGGLMPAGFPWLKDDNAEKGCTHVFVRDKVKELTQSEHQRRCSTEYLDSDEAKQDALGSNLRRLCQFVKALNGTVTDAAILNLYIDSFRSEQYMTCACPAETRIRGLKVLASWVKEVPLHTTAVAREAKVIRFHRASLWSRYMSQKIAEATNIWTTHSRAEKDRQLQTLSDSKKLLTVSIDNMFTLFHYLKLDDAEVDTWAKTHGTNTLWLEHESCLSDTVRCFTKMYNFLGIDPSHISSNPALYAPSYDHSNSDRLLQHVSNPELIREALGAHGMSQFIGIPSHEAIRHLVHVPLGQVTRVVALEPGVRTVVMEGDAQSNKFSAAIPLLQEMNPDALVVISDHRGAAVNLHLRTRSAFYESVVDFRKGFAAMTDKLPGAVVVSASGQCCASALTHIQPGALFDEANKRQARSCISGDVGCVWNGNANAEIWQARMKEIATLRSASTAKSVYLDASLIAGTAKDLLALLETVDVGSKEDERAVMTDFMHRNPDRIVLDYGRRLFAKGFDGHNSERNKDCSFDGDSSDDAAPDVVSIVPLFSHVSRDLGCATKVTAASLAFPVWHDKGIAIGPLIDHIHDLSVAEKSVSGIDLHFGPEILYVVDGKGVWTSKKLDAQINNETKHFRNVPTNKMIKVAHGILLSADKDSTRWKRLKRSVSSGGFFYFAWYGDYKHCNHKNKGEHSIPLFTTCAIRGCQHAFPTPAYMSLIESQKSRQRWQIVFEEFDRDYPFESKVRCPCCT